MFENLPVLGVGVSLSLSAQPDPVALVQEQGGPQFVEYAGQAEVERVLPEVERIRAAGVPVLFHPSYINFCGSFANSPAWLAETARHIDAVGSPWFAQDCAYCFWQEGHGYSTQLGYFLPPILNEASLQQAIIRVREVKSAIPVTVAIEPPPMTFVAGRMPLFTFFGRLAQEADCALLLDMGHLVSWEMASGQRVMDAIADLPCERVIEVHIAGGKLRQTAAGPVYIDMHESTILDEVWAMLEAMLPLLPNVKALCYECEGMDHDTVMAGLERLRTLVRERSASPALVASILRQGCSA
ncbi:MAG: DUF692 family protein [Moraxellaceae bacterium]|jgi:uncharacterized protein (UPF0276 family)|nr:DUF692 family protein [Moraxellaceae bacterium]MCC6200787.1 DUF692 family protein [Moraxellaceae bacterium]HQV42281.1 DUF692 family protein [Moraxellaceae bacterium]HQX90683.1 DUF692 family protein [Moraxellaceae bacterium]